MTTPTRTYSPHPDAPARFTAHGWGRAESNYGKPKRLVRNMFAALVTEALTGGPNASGLYVCPIARIAGEPVLFRLGDKSAEVDRPWEGDFYAPGNVCYVSVIGNQARNSQDFPGLMEYRRKVLEVSQTIRIPGPSEAFRWHQKIENEKADLVLNF